MTDLAPIPLDDFTLTAIEHSLDACLTNERPHGAEGDGPWLIGADYQLPALLDFLAGYNADNEQSYSNDDLIRALVAEVRRLRKTTKEDA